MINNSNNRNSKSEKSVNVNYDIKANWVVVIDEHGQNLGQMSLHAAIAKAEEKDLDLVEVAKNAVPPITKMINYGKFLYEQKKKAKDKAKSARLNAQETHTIQIHLATEQNDLNHKFNQIRKFIKDGDVVKFAIVLRGRELANKKAAFDLMSEILEQLSSEVSYDAPAKMVGKNLEIMLKAPKK